MRDLLRWTVVASVLFVASVTMVGAWTLRTPAGSRRPQLHHAYYGLVVIGVTWVGIVPVWVGWIGFVVLADDTIQHAMKVWWPEFRSPSHSLYAVTLYRWLGW